jgi:hypothetical protein
MKKSARLLLCTLLLVAGACSREEPTEPAVATASLSLNKDRAAIGSPLRMTYKFDVAQNAAFDGDYAVFVHVVGPDGETLWQDDHQPAVPTSQWKPGQTIEYTRLIFVPNYPYLGDATIRLGLYNPATGKRLSLAGEQVGRQEYALARLNLLPQGENIYLIYRDGWYPPEVDPNNPLIEWQWTKKNATLAFKNPKRDSTFYLKIDARTDLFNPPQQVVVKVAGQPLATFAADAKDPVLKTLPISAAQFGDGDMTEISFEIDRVFTAPNDARELGIRVYQVFVEPK